MADRPKSQQQLKSEKKAAQNPAEREYVWVTNISKQSVPIQLMAPKGVDFIVGEQSMALAPGESEKFPRERIYLHQVQNLQKMRKIRIRIVKG